MANKTYDLLQKFGLTDYLKKDKYSLYKTIAVHLTIFLIYFFIGGLIGEVTRYFLFDKIGYYDLIVSFVVGFIFSKLFSKTITVFIYRFL